jgi:MIP family channel proteins
MLERDYLRRGIAEGIGTFALVFVGAGGVAYASTLGDVALANGLAIAVMVTAAGVISGGHINPAITLGFLATRRITASLAVCYWIFQFGGAALAGVLLKWVLPSAQENARNLGAPALGTGISSGKGIVVEAVLTFFLAWVVFATAVDPRGAWKQIAGLAIGFTIVMDVLFGFGITGGMMNPARAFGPQLAGDHWKDWWVWYVGPFAGAVIAAALYELLYLRPTQPEPVGPPETGVEEPGAGETAYS